MAVFTQGKSYNLRGRMDAVLLDGEVLLGPRQRQLWFQVQGE